MITNIDNLTVIVNASGPSSWNGINVAGESLWVKQRNVCAKCQCEVESSGVKECPHCNAKVITSMQKYLNASDVPQEYETYSARKKPASIEKSQKTNIFKVIEHSQYRFDILKASVEVTGEYIFEKNPHYIDKSKRDEEINYGIPLEAVFTSRYKVKSMDIKFKSCYSYDLNKKPGERITLEVDEIGNFIEVNKKNLELVYTCDKCGDVSGAGMANTQWIRQKIYNASASKSLRNTLFSFEDPSLKTELAIKHNLSIDDIIIKNHTATKLHEMLGVSKACLKFIIDQDNSKYSEIENTYRESYKKRILELYHNLGDGYRKFFKDIEMFCNDESIRFFSAFQVRDKITTLYYIGYDMNRLYEYLTEECKWQQGLSFNRALDDLYDYAKMCEELELRDYDRYPKALRTRHDVIVMRYNSVKMDKEEEQNFENVVKKYKKLEYKTSKYLLRIAKSPKELVQEGNDLNHCVGSYADRMANETNVIFFLREIDSPNKSLATIEINKIGNDIDGYKLKLGQCKGAFNRNLDIEEKRFINKFGKSVLGKAIVCDDGQIKIIRDEDRKKDKVITLEDLKALEKALLENNDTIAMCEEVIATAN